VLGYLVAKSLRAKFLPQAFFDLFSPEWKNEHWLNSWRQKVASYLFKHADSIRVVSTAQRENLVKHLGILPERIKVIPVGVNFQPALGSKELYKNKIACGLATKKVVLFVARFHPQKNVSLWVDIAAEVSRMIPEAAFVMVGDGPLFSDIQAKVRQKGLADRFHFLGSLDYEQLPEAYAAADVFLLSSDYEGLCRVLVESYLAGVPVVSTASGAEDVIIDGETGFILPCGDCRGLTGAVVKLLQDDEMRERFGRLGQEKVTAQFALEALAEKLITCWESA
jgi:glycosyltransferase involved in cell wall biosynthesis